MKIILITVDTNDADYAHVAKTMTEEEYKNILPVIEAIKNFKPYPVYFSDGRLWFNNGHNFCTFGGDKGPEELYVSTGVITKEELEMFMEIFCDSVEEFHTITKIVVYDVINEQILIEE